MPRDASGTYTLPIAPFQPLTLAKSAEMNVALTDIADALTDSWSRASPTPAQGDLNLNGHNILNLGGRLDVPGDLTAGGNLSVTGQVATIGTNTTANPLLAINGAAATSRFIIGQTAGLNRWMVIPGDATAETGSNAGSDFAITRYADDGTTYLGAPLSINRATGRVTLSQQLNAGGGISTTNIGVSGNATVSGTLTAGTITSNGALSVPGNATVSGTLTTNDLHTSGLTATTAQVNGNATVTGTITTNDLHTSGLTVTTAQVNGNAAVAGTLTAGYVHAPVLSVIDGSFYLNTFGTNGRQLLFEANTAIVKDANGPDLIITVGNGGRLVAGPAGRTAIFDTAGDLYVNNTGFKPGGGAWAATSDDRVKRNVADYKTGLAEILALRPISYEYTGEGGTVDNGRTYVGLSAQATRAVMPELVFELPAETEPQPGLSARLPGQLALDPSALTYALVRAVQELSAQVTALEAKVAAGH